MSVARRWKTFPGVVVVSGDHDYLRIREVATAVMAAKKSGKRVVHIDAGDSDGLREVCQGGFLIVEDIFAIVESERSGSRRGDGGWGDADVDMVVANAEHKEHTSLLVHHEKLVTAKSFAGLVAARIPKNGHIVFAAPKPWEAKEAATKFLIDELSRRGKKIADPLASALVTRVGSDFGPLAFEAQKVAALLDARGRTDVSQDDLVGLVASFGSEDWQALKEALGARNCRAVVRALGEIRAGPSGDSAMPVMVILAREVTQWLHTAALMEQGVSRDEALSRLHVKPFILEKNLIPPSRRWGRVRLAALLRGIVDAMAGVRRGHQNSWVALESTLVLGCADER